MHDRLCKLLGVIRHDWLHSWWSLFLVAFKLTKTPWALYIDLKPPCQSKILKLTSSRLMNRQSRSPRREKIDLCIRLGCIHTTISFDRA